MIFSERRLISSIRDRQDTISDRLVKGIGDDCAVYRPPPSGPGTLSLITTDALVESVHFDLAWHPPYLLGRKALAVNLSDIAAMGGRALHVLLTIGFSGSQQVLDQVMAGFQDALQQQQVQLIGGDTVKNPQGLLLSVTVIGEADQHKVLYRSGARPGDLVWVSGPLGQAAAGLELCRRQHQEADKGFESLIEAHLDPTPMTKLGPILAESGMLTAMMDLSDGLATDLAHLCAESGVGAEVEAAKVPLSKELLILADKLGCSPLDWALQGGEDYQLLFTSPAQHATSLADYIKEASGSTIYCLGVITEKSGVRLCSDQQKMDISYRGFDHFVAQQPV